jgi:hypothetical protein
VSANAPSEKAFSMGVSIAEQAHQQGVCGLLKLFLTVAFLFGSGSWGNHQLWNRVFRN